MVDSTVTALALRGRVRHLDYSVESLKNFLSAIKIYRINGSVKRHRYIVDSY